MERMLVKQGRNALTVTLPAEWLRRRGLTQGDPVRLDEQEEALVIRPGSAATRREITVDLRNADRSTIWHKLCAVYIDGYDRITALHTGQKEVDDFGLKLIGMLVEEQSASKVVFGSIVAEPEDNTVTLLRRAGHMFVEQARLVERIARGEDMLEQLKKQERALDTTLLYCQRLINKYERTERGYQLFLFCAWLEIAGDHVAIIAEHIGKDSALAKRIGNAAQSYVEGIFENDYQKLYTTLRSFRNSVEKKTFADGAAYVFADTLYNNISVFIEGSEQLNAKRQKHLNARAVR